MPKSNPRKINPVNRMNPCHLGQDAWLASGGTFIRFDNFVSLWLNNLSRAFSYASVPALVIRPSNLSSLTTINPLYRAPLGIISRCWFRPKDRRRRPRPISVVDGCKLEVRGGKGGEEAAYGRCLDWIKGALHRSKGLLIRSGKKQRVPRVA